MRCWAVRRKKRTVEDDYPMECPECGGLPKKDDVGDLVCDKCGLVLEDAIDLGKDYRVYEPEHMGRSREGPPKTPLRHDGNLPTEIGRDNRDAHGNPFPSRQRGDINRMRWTAKRNRMNSSYDRNLAYALQEMEKVASHCEIPRNIKERAAVLYRKCLDKGLMRGRTIEGLIGACIYAACREYNVPRTLDEIVIHVPRTGRKELGRIYRLVTRELDLKKRPSTPFDYVDRFCSALKLNVDVIHTVKDILDRADEKRLLSGRVPTGVAAAAIYAACILKKQMRTQREISDVCGVTEVTIRNRYREIVDELGLEMPGRK